MKNITNSLMPLAAFVLFGSCLISVFSLLMLLMMSFGFADALPIVFYRRLNVPLLSVALPMVGMILFTAILLVLLRKPAEAIESTVIGGPSNPPMSNEEKKDEHLVEAA